MIKFQGSVDRSVISVNSVVFLALLLFLIHEYPICVYPIIFLSHSLFFLLLLFLKTWFCSKQSLHPKLFYGI
ncbi:hypothetical protein BDF14DRAFT_1806401 [Spinellus fusiger]|nr:hypothetical protein BDF14DRAFT_1806401 [Spinellus fusiger]